MPSTSAKQHRFMQAVAHSPSFAKKAGVSQSVGKDFSAADKGKTFNKGGTMKKGKRFNGDDDKSVVEYHDYDPDKSYSGRFTDDETGGLAENMPTRAYKPEKRETEATPSRAPSARAPASAPATTARAVPAATASSPGVTAAQEAALVRREQETQNTEILKREADEDKRSPRATAQEGTYRGTGNRRSGALYLDGTPEEQEAEAKKRMDVVMAVMPYGKLGFAGKTVGKLALKGPELSAAARAMAARTREATRQARLATPAGKAAEVQRISDVVKKMAEKSGPKAATEARIASATRKYNEGRTPAAQDAWRKANPKDRNANLFAKGGAIMEPKSMKFAMGGSMPSPSGARPDPRMMAAMRAQAARQQPMRRPPPGGMPPPAQPPMGMKKGGMPMKDGKPAFMQKKMMGGGMAYAKGGGIESRGKTKGTIIRMAAGGSVSSRADGIAQRGKTKFTNY